ncbi:hypothetical protein PRIC1_012147 [Phytophthora ramorum]
MRFNIFAIKYQLNVFPPLIPSSRPPNNWPKANRGIQAWLGSVASESQSNVDRRERLRKLALETVDLTKDPYFMKNHLGSYECKLCLTLHNNEGNYLAHTQGKRHQTNLARRATKEAADAAHSTATANLQEARAAAAAAAARPRALKIG